MLGSEFNEGCSIRYADDAVLVTVYVRLGYAQEHHADVGTHASQPLSPAFARLSAAVGQYLSDIAGPHSSNESLLRTPSQCVVAQRG
jgi:hypothetical protein